MSVPLLRVVGRVYGPNNSLKVYFRNNAAPGENRPVINAGDKYFAIDSLIPPSAAPEEAFRSAAAPEISTILKNGGNAVVVVFGDSGTGRSALLEGEGGTGLLHFGLREIFRFASANTTKTTSFQVLVSFLQTRGNVITDLLNSSGSVSFKGGKLTGLSTRKLDSVAALSKVLTEGSRTRSERNDGSSRGTGLPHSDSEMDESMGLHTLVSFTVLELSKAQNDGMSPFPSPSPSPSPSDGSDSDRPQTPTTPTKRHRIVRVRSVGFLCTARSGEMDACQCVYREPDVSVHDSFVSFLRSCGGPVVHQILRPVLSKQYRASVVVTLGDEIQSSVHSLCHISRLLNPPPPSTQLALVNINQYRRKEKEKERLPNPNNEPLASSHSNPLPRRPPPIRVSGIGGGGGESANVNANANESPKQRPPMPMSAPRAHPQSAGPRPAPTNVPPRRPRPQSQPQPQSPLSPQSPKSTTSEAELEKLRQQVRRAESNAARLAEEADYFRTQMEEQGSDARNGENRYRKAADGARRDLSEAKEELERQEQRNGDLERQIRSLKDQLKREMELSSSSAAASVSSGHNEVNVKLRQAEDELFTARRQIRELLEENERQQSESNRLRADLSKSRAKRADHVHDLDLDSGAASAEILRSTLDQERRRNQQTVLDLRTRMEKVVTERDSLLIDLRQARDANSYLEDEIKRQRSADERMIDELNESLVYAKRSNDRDREALQNLRSELEESRSECGALRKQNDSLRVSVPTQTSNQGQIDTDLRSSQLGTPTPLVNSTSRELGRLRAMMLERSSMGMGMGVSHPIAASPSEYGQYGAGLNASVNRGDSEVAEVVRLRQEVRSLQAEFEAVRDEKEHLEAENQAANARLRAEERSRTESEKQVSDLRTHVDALSNESETLQRSVMQLKQSASRDAQDLSDAEDRLRTADETIAHLRGEVDAMEPRLSTFEKENAKLLLRVQSLSDQLNEVISRSDETVQQMEAEIAKLTAGREDALRQLDQSQIAEERAKLSAEDLQNKLEDAKHQNAEAKNAYEKELARLREGSEIGVLSRQLSSARSDAENREAQLKQELALALDKVESVRTESIEVQQRLESELKRTRLDADSIQRELTALRSESSASSTAVDRLRDKMRRDKTQWADEHQAELRRRQDVHDRELMNLRDELERETTRLRETAEREQNSIAASMEKEQKTVVDRLERELKTVTEARNQAVKQLEKARSEADVARTASNAAERENERLSSEVATARETQDRWSRGALAREEETAKYRRQLAQARTELEEYQKNVSSLEDALARARAESSKRIPAADYERERSNTTRLQREIGLLQSERDSLRATVEQLQSRVSDLENGTEVARVLKENLKLKNELSEHEGHVAVSQGRIDSIVPELEIQSKRVVELQMAVAKLEQEKAEMIRHVEAAAATHTDTIQRAASELNELRAEVQRLKSADKTVRAEISTRDGELEQSMMAMDDARIEIGRLRAERDMLKTHVSNIETQLETGKATYESVVEARRKEVEELRSSLASLQRSHAGLTVEVDASKQQNAMLSETLTRETKRGEDYRQKLYEAQSTAKLAEGEAHAAKSDLALITEERDKLAATQLKLEQSINSTEKRAGAAESDLAKSVAVLGDREFELKRLAEDRDLWKSQADTQREAADAWRKKALDTEEEESRVRQEMEEKLNSERNTVSKLSYDHKELKNQFDLLVSQREELKSQIDEEHRQTLRLQSERDEMAGRTHQMETEAKNKTKLAEAMSLQVSDLRDRAMNAEAAKSHLQSELRQTNRELEDSRQRLSASASRPSVVGPPPMDIPGSPLRAEALQTQPLGTPMPLQRSSLARHAAMNGSRPGLSPRAPRSTASRRSVASVALQAKEKAVDAAEEENARLMAQVLKAEQDIQRMKEKEKKRARGVKSALAMSETERSGSRRGSKGSIGSGSNA